MNAVTIPADKLAELQRKAKLVDELLEAFEECVGAAIDKYNEKIVQTYDDIGYYPPAVEKYKLRQRYLKELLAKAKEQSCSTLCHPEEECFITESGKCAVRPENYKLYTFPESGVQIIPPQIANIDPVTGDVSIGKEE